MKLRDNDGGMNELNNEFRGGVDWGWIIRRMDNLSHSSILNQG